MNVQDSGYSDAANAASDKLGQLGDARDQGMQAAGAGGDAGGQNPIADALRVLAMFVAAQQQAGNPAAEAMKQALLAFMNSTKGGAPQGPQAPAQPQQPPIPGPAGEQPQAPASPGEQYAQANKRGQPQIM